MCVCIVCVSVCVCACVCCTGWEGGIGPKDGKVRGKGGEVS